MNATEVRQALSHFDASFVRLKKGRLTRDVAIACLEEWAALAEDGHKPELRDYRDLIPLVELAIGRRISSLSGPTKVLIRPQSEATCHLRFTSGVYLGLSSDGVVTVDIDPEAVSKTLRLFAMVGIGVDKDGATDVAQNHDEYLVDAYLNAGTSDAAER